MTSTTHDSILLSCDNVSWSADDKSILSQISFAVNRGSFTGIIGPNGAGKSSLLRCLYRFIKPSHGAITFAQQNIWSFLAKDYAKKVAVVLQHTPQHFQLSVFDVVHQGLIPHTSLLTSFTESKGEHTLIENALEQVGLLDKAKQAFELLSGGEKQRAMIAKAIVQKPELLIMDEPTSHLDVKYQIQIMELAKSLGITVIASFHDLNLASAMCDQVLVLKQGKLVADGKPTQVFTESVLSDVFDVCVDVKPHPQHQKPHVIYYYGYQPTGAGSAGVEHD